MEQRYRALRIVGSIYKILGGIAGIITLLFVVTICASSVLGGAALNSFGREIGDGSGFGGLFSGVVGGAILSTLAILYGGTITVTLYGFGEAIYLLLALEENTRTMALILRSQATAE